MKQTSTLYILLLLALSLCGACTTEAERRQMERIVAEADSMNRNYVPLTTDSLLLQACRYYDRHGQPNERMRAHYLLGCAYRDMGEAPRAIDAYQDAAACADTLAEDCDFRKLSSVYSQMAWAFHHQLLFSYEKDARRLSCQYAEKANCPLIAIDEMKLIVGIFILMNKKDSAEVLIKNVLQLYGANGYEQKEIQASTKLMHLFIERPERLSALKQLIDKYDAKCSLFNENHELPPSKRLFYYYKGKYFEGVNLLDSAEYYYRKIYRPVMSYADKNSMFEGLLSVFKRRNLPDSIAKYAQLYCIVNDSSIAIKDQDLTARLAASYRFNSIQREAVENEKKANQAIVVTIILVVFILVFMILAVVVWKRAKEKQLRKYLRLKEEYTNAADIYNRNLSTLRIIDDSRKAALADMESAREELMSENCQLKVKIDNLRKQTDIAKNVIKTDEFSKTDIFKRIQEVRNISLYSLSDDERKQLRTIFGDYFPNLLHSLWHTDTITQSGMDVCLLVAMNIHTGEIANMLSMSLSQVSNLKQDVNFALFGDNSARSLYKNLVQKYDIYF